MANKIKSKKYQKKAALIDRSKPLPLSKAIPLVKKLNYSKYDASVEAHFNLNLDFSLEGQGIRATCTLPHGTGKKIKVLVFSTTDVKGADLSGGEDLVEKIKSGKVDPTKYNVVLSTPELMGKVASCGKILGPQGLMPNPKSGTVVKDPQKAVEQFKKGKVSVRTEPNFPVIHTAFGKVSFKDKDLIENFTAILNTIKENKPQKAPDDFVKSVYISTSQSPSIQVDLSSMQG